MSIRDELEDYPWECGDCADLEICPCGEHGWCDKFSTFVDVDDQNVCEDFEPNWYAAREAEREIAEAKAAEEDEAYDRYRDSLLEDRI